MEDGMAERTADYSRDMVLGMAAIANALLDQDDVDAAVIAAQRAAEIAPAVESNRASDGLRAFAARLPSNNPMAAELHDYLRAESKN
jgi:hypothetical protein